MDYELNSECWYKNVCNQSMRACGNGASSSCIRFLEMKHLMDSSGIPKIRQYPIALTPDEVDYDAFCKLAEIKDDIEPLVHNGEFNLYICSNNPGTGKTTWAIKLLLKYFDSIWAGNGFRTRGLLINVPTLLLQLKDFQNPVSEEYKNNILNSDLVIFDDIAVSGIGQYDYNNLLMYIDNRMLNGKANIYTSNKTTKQSLESVIGSRLASRIWEMSTIIEFRGKDRRNG